MKLPGWCTDCKKVKRVNVSSAALARIAMAGSSTVYGECDDCIDKRTPRGSRRG